MSGVFGVGVGFGVGVLVLGCLVGLGLPWGLLGVAGEFSLVGCDGGRG